MTVEKVADAKADKDHWLEARKSYLTSSEMFSWRGPEFMTKATAKWWSDDQESVLAGKRGVEKEFDQESETSIWHGTYDEENILEKFGNIVGCCTKPDNGLYVNSRYPGVAASIDGYGKPAKEAPLYPEACQDRTLVPYIRDFIDVSDCVFITEVKKSTSSKFQTEVPEYYVAQVKTQLCVLDLPYAIIMADTFKRGDAMKWRYYWDFKMYVIEYDPAFEDILKREGEKFLTLTK